MDFSTSGRGIFLSTPSARRATQRDENIVLLPGISIHALCEEGDEIDPRRRRPVQNFYPRPLRGGRLRRVSGVQVRELISIHALCEEGDLKNVV